MNHLKIFAVTIVLFFILLLPVFSDSYFTGDGRKDLSIQIDTPKLVNIDDETSAWLYDTTINTFTDYINKYSNINVSDVYNQERIAEAQKNDENALYSSDNEIEIGNFTVAKYILVVSITGKPSSYSVSARLNNKETNTPLAAHNKDYSYDELESCYFIKESIMDLLTQLGVNLTESGKNSLLKVSETNGDLSIEAQKLVAKGAEAERKGSKVEAMSYYFKANAADPSLQRAIDSLSRTSKSIAAGDYGTKARNLIQQRKDFISLINTLSDYFKNNIPYYVVYDDDIQMGKIDYKNETFDINVKLAVVKDIEKEKIYKNIVKAYKNESGSDEWGLERQLNSAFPSANFIVTVCLKDKDGNELSKKDVQMNVGSSNYNFASWGSYSLPVSANSDTTNIILEVPSVKNSYNENILVNRLLVKDYVNKVFAKTFILEEIVPSVSVLTISNYESKSDCNSFLKYFGFESIEDFSSKISLGKNMKTVRKEDLVYTKNESEALNHVFSNSKTINRNVFYINEAKSKFPRLKSEYEKNIGQYLPFEYEKISGSDYMFVKNTDDLRFLVSLVMGKDISSKQYSYYKTESLGPLLDIIMADEKDESRRVYAYSYSDDLTNKFNKTSPVELFAVNSTNKTNSTDSNGNYIGEYDPALRDFSYYISLNDKSKILAIYTYKPELVLNNKLPKMKSFIPEYEISKTEVSDSLLSYIKWASAFENFPYEFSSPKIEAKDDFELAVNALNELLGFEPFLKDSNGGFAHKKSEIVKKDFNTNGFMVPTENEYSKCKPSIKKAIDKETAKGSGKYFFIMRKK